VTRFLLDTNVISELRKVRPHGAVVAWMETLREDQIFVSAVTFGKLQARVEITRKQNATKAQEIESWLTEVERSFSFVPMDSACFRESSRLLAGKGDDLRDDAMIAATARVHGFTVATRNEKDFKRLGIEIFNPFKSN
jgi:predicted nucleic acid-binding protein